VACHISATWPKLHTQQLPRGQNHAISAKKWGQEPFSNNFFLQGCNSNFFFYRDENQNTPKLPKHKSYLSHLNIKNCGKEKQANGCHTTWQGPNFVGKRWLAVKFVFKAKRKNCTWKETKTRTTALLVFYLESN